MSDNIAVVCRVRPLNESQNETKALSITSAKELIVESKDKTFTFDYIADCGVNQADFFSELGPAACDSCLEGFNGTIIFYGNIKIRS